MTKDPQNDSWSRANKLGAWRKHMLELLEDITQEKQWDEIFYAQSFGGIHCTKTRRSIVSPTTYVKEWVNPLGVMKFH
jgi:hypothetical protein